MKKKTGTQELAYCDRISSGGRTEEATTITRYAIAEHNLTVVCEAADFSEHIHVFTGALATDEGSPAIRLVIFRGSKGPHNTIQFCAPELDLAVSERAGADAWIRFRRIFMRLALNHHLPHYVMHASSVTNGRGRTALVVGVSDAGKTSTMLGLLRRGYQYVCDDYSCIRFEDGRLVSLPVGCTVTEKTFAMFPELEELRSENCKFYCQKQWQWTINPADLYPHVPAYETLEPTDFFFLYPNHGGESSITPLDRDEALWWFQTGRLLSRNVTPQFVASDLEHHQKSFELALRTLDTARFHRVLNGEIHDTVDLIDAVLDAAPVPAPA